MRRLGQCVARVPTAVEGQARPIITGSVKESSWRRNQWRTKKRELAGGPIVHDVSQHAQFAERNKALGSEEYADYVPESKFPMVIESGKVEYGDEAYSLYRALYKELAEEMRAEVFNRPPPPVDYWKVLHAPNTRFATFVREEGMMHNARAVMYTDLDIRDSEAKNPTLPMAAWLPVDIFIIRGKIVMHYATAAIDNNTHIRNVRMYRDKEGILATADLGMSYVRDYLRYDGPAMCHLEQDVQTELWDILMDYGFDDTLFKWVSLWTYYLEHVEYVRWSRSFMHLVLPDGVREEQELLSREERVELDAASGEHFEQTADYIPAPPEWPEDRDETATKHLGEGEGPDANAKAEADGTANEEDATKGKEAAAAADASGQDKK